MSHMLPERKVAGLPGPGQVTTGIRGLGMTKRTRDLAKRGTGGVVGGSGQVIRMVDLVAWAQRQPGSPGRAGAPGVPHRRPGPGWRAAAAAGSLTLFSHAGAALSQQAQLTWPGAGPGIARPSPGASDQAGDSAQRAR